MRIASLFSPIFRHTRRVLEGAAITVIAMHVVGKGRGGSAEAVYDRLCGLDVVMWFTGWVQVKTRAGSWAIWSAAGVMLVGNLTPAGRRQSGALS